MSRFFDPPQAKPLIAKEKIDKVFKSMRFNVFMGSFLGYAAYYLVRKNLSLASADMIAEGLIDKQGVGIAVTCICGRCLRQLSYVPRRGVAKTQNVCAFGCGRRTDDDNGRKIHSVIQESSR